MHTHLNNILRLHYCCWNQMKWTIVTISWFWERERERKDINFEFTLLLYLREFIANSLLRRHLSVCFRKNRIWFERNRCVKHMPVFHNSQKSKRRGVGWILEFFLIQVHHQKWVQEVYAHTCAMLPFQTFSFFVLYIIEAALFLIIWTKVYKNSSKTVFKNITFCN